MKLTFVFTILSLLTWSSVHAQSFSKLSRQIQHQCRERPRGYPAARQKLYELEKLPFIFKADTSYMLQSFDVESGTLHGTIWNVTGNVSYNYTERQIKIDSLSYFTKFMTATVQHWDTVTIREEERKYSDMNPQRWVTAIRIIQNKDKKFAIDCIDFKYFANPKRDAFD